MKPVSIGEMQRIVDSLKDRPADLHIEPQAYGNISMISCPHCYSTDVMIHELMSEGYGYPVFDCANCCMFSADHTLEGEVIKPTSKDWWD